MYVPSSSRTLHIILWCWGASVQRCDDRHMCLQIFGATEEDIAKLKIVSLQEVDLDVLDSMVGKREDA